MRAKRKFIKLNSLIIITARRVYEAKLLGGMKNFKLKFDVISSRVKNKLEGQNCWFLGLTKTSSLYPEEHFL